MTAHGAPPVVLQALREEFYEALITTSSPRTEGRGVLRTRRGEPRRGGGDLPTLRYDDHNTLILRHVAGTTFPTPVLTRPRTRTTRCSPSATEHAGVTPELSTRTRPVGADDADPRDEDVAFFYAEEAPRRRMVTLRRPQSTTVALRHSSAGK